MTALNEFDRLEAAALWRPDEDAQRQEVIVSMGEATLTLTDMSGMALSHWSLPALERTNAPTDTPAIYRPAPDSAEELEIEDATLIDAIERVQKAVARGRAHPGRLRGMFYGALTLGALGLGVFWLPEALIRHTVSIVPPVTRAQIGQDLLERVERLSGQPCNTIHGARALSKLKTRLFTTGGGKIVVLPSGVKETQHLPGRILLLNRNLVEDFDRPEATAGFILAELERAQAQDPLQRLLEEAGLISALRLMTTGELPQKVLDTHAEGLFTAPQVQPTGENLIARFAAAEVPIRPYAYAIDLTGETVLHLIEADGVQIETTRPVLGDSDWIALQGVCFG